MLSDSPAQAAVADAEWTAAGDAVPVHHEAQPGAAAAHENRSAMTGAAQADAACLEIADAALVHPLFPYTAVAHDCLAMNAAAAAVAAAVAARHLQDAAGERSGIPYKSSVAFAHHAVAASSLQAANSSTAPLVEMHLQQG